MSNIIERDAKSGRFQTGNIGGGRKPGSRNKLSEAFLSDVEASWRQHGAEVLDRVARDEPGTYLRAIVALMPREAMLSVDVALDVRIAEALEGLRAVNGGKRMVAAERLIARLLKSDIIDAEP
ncbi:MULTISPECIES: hypothetical protein [unclassified Bradyrhizobium]|uniref:hypothetical protein n=1 Tax=unclassified Bradyrhizobium TaxID=2631580 RepID=UPI0028EAD4DC|nr:MULTISPECIES: hypothetical protein [unclassified Bradyrhizobium]